MYFLSPTLLKPGYLECALWNSITKGWVRKAESQALPQKLLVFFFVLFFNKLVRGFADTLKIESMHLKDAHSKKTGLAIKKDFLPAGHKICYGGQGEGQV